MKLRVCYAFLIVIASGRIAVAAGPSEPEDGHTSSSDVRMMREIPRTKQRVLDDFLSQAQRRHQEGEKPQHVAIGQLEDEAPVGKSPSGAAQVRDDLAFYGTGGFGLVVEVSSTTSSSYRGYIVDARTSGYQDMVILDSLSGLDAGTYTIDAACTDLHKDFPAPGARMSSNPWTSDSQSSWAYWVRRASTRGSNQGRSFDEIQATIWYITDRDGAYDDYPLLESIGYGRNGPSKNSTQGPGTGGADGCGAGLCGVGTPMMIPFMLASLCFVKLRSRSPRRRK